jgi:Putative heavy-metal-binding
LPAYTDLIVKARRDACSQMELQVRGLGADGVVVSGMAKRVRRFACRVHRGSTDHFAEVVITGTAIARFAASAGARAVPTLAVLPVGRPGELQRTAGENRSR